ncbi:MAG: ATP-binding cassette domain-containing protein [Alphaproteobacteria bacterium]|nr:ATP-binding cassette domain-containing protein [Alphaproteobacteria bacterium]
MSASVELRDLTLGYRRHPAVHHVSGQFAPGSLTAIVGPNGAGKTTLLRGIAGTLKPLDGEIVRHHCRRGDIAYLPQQADLDRSFPISVGDTIAMGLWRRTGLFGAFGRDCRERLATALSAVGLEGFAPRPIATLSGGQLQRVLFARLLVQDASLILLDEPFAAIDAKTQSDLIGVIRRWHGDGRTIIAVLHDLETVRAHFPQALLLAREAIAWGPTAEALAPAHLLSARRMSERWVDDAPACERVA